MFLRNTNSKTTTFPAFIKIQQAMSASSFNLPRKQMLAGIPCLQKTKLVLSLVLLDLTYTVGIG